MVSSVICLKCGTELGKEETMCRNCKSILKKIKKPLTFRKDYLSQKSCFHCGSKNLAPLMFISHDGIPHGSKDHAVTYYHFALVSCSDCKTGFIEKHDHDCWSYDEIWDLDEWYLFDIQAMEKIQRELLKKCPDPLSSICKCNIHNKFRSEIYSLPREPWESLSEDQKHVQKFDKKHIHKISLSIENKLPKIKMISNGDN